ncbi:MAG: hypothetical protein IJS28_08175 [Synergistaceae bacterium]|nr:hypothetical protein [Synergistaceae bacterium]
MLEIGIMHASRITHHASRHTSLSVNSGINANYNISCRKNLAGDILCLPVDGRTAS